MKKTKKDQKPTTISADPSVRDDLKQIAEKMGMTQRKCLALIMDEKVHRDKVNSRKKREEFEQLDVPEALNQINRRLEKIEKGRTRGTPSYPFSEPRKKRFSNR